MMAGAVVSQEQEAIPWKPDTKLSWFDFRGKPFKTAWAAATTASGISYEFTTWDNEGELALNYKIHTYFYPEQSWYQPELCNAVILSHEQLHFDISELFARKMRKIMEENTFTKNVKEEVKLIYTGIIKELTAFQKKYDHATNFSRDVEQQLIWNHKIAEALEDGIPVSDHSVPQR